MPEPRSCKRCGETFVPPRSSKYCQKCKDYFDDRFRPYRDGIARENTRETRDGID